MASTCSSWLSCDAGPPTVITPSPAACHATSPPPTLLHQPHAKSFSSRLPCHARRPCSHRPYAIPSSCRMPSHVYPPCLHKPYVNPFSSRLSSEPQPQLSRSPAIGSSPSACMCPGIHSSHRCYLTLPPGASAPQPPGGGPWILASAPYLAELLVCGPDGLSFIGRSLNSVKVVLVNPSGPDTRSQAR